MSERTPGTLRARTAEPQGEVRSTRSPGSVGAPFDAPTLTIEKASDPLFWIGRDARFLYVNQAACRALGYTRDELLRLRVHDIDPLLPADRWDSHWEEMADSKTSVFESVHQRRDGAEFPVEIHVNYVEHEGQGYVCAFARDVTARKRAEALQRGHAKVLERLAAGASLETVLTILTRTLELVRPDMRCGILLVDRERNCLTRPIAPSMPAWYLAAADGLPIGPGSACCGTAAYTGERVIVRDVMEHPSWAAFRDLARRAAIRACWSEPIRATRGAVLGTFAVYYREPREPDAGDVELMVNSAHLAGISIERKLTEEELWAARNDALEAARLKSKFLANMSHEIRTPMTSILGFTELLLRDARQDPVKPATRLGLESIHRNASHLLDVINDILDLSKIEADRLEVRLVSCSPAALLAEVASLLRPRALEKGLRFALEIETPIPESIRTDPTRVRQILINLVGNAIKFTERGAVELRARLDADGAEPRLVIEVADTGVGLTAEDAEAVFEAFAQADSSTTRRFGGTGLGLTISRRLARLLGADIEVTSEPGRGSRFRVLLPTGPIDGVRMLDGTDPADCLPESVEPGNAEELRLAGRVLIAEDGRDNQRLISLILSRAGLEVEIAPNGLEACAKALQAEEFGDPFDVVLMDMQMPELDGYEATARLRGAGYTRPIIALTAHAMSGDRERSARAGCDDHATKPIQPATLLRLIALHMAKNS